MKELDLSLCESRRYWDTPDKKNRKYISFEEAFKI